MEIMAIGKYERQSAQDRVIALLKAERGNPLSVEDISFRLKISKDTVSHVIHSIQHSTELCQENDKFYFPVNKIWTYAAAVGWLIACGYFFVDLIRFYHI